MLQTAGRDICNAILSYFYKKDLIIIPKFECKFLNTEKEEEKRNASPSFKPVAMPAALKIFSFDQENLIQEIEAVKEVQNEDKEFEAEQNENNSNKSKDEAQEEVSDGSDSEPSLDNFDNDQLVKLLPSFPKKKSKFFKSTNFTYIILNILLNCLLYYRKKT